MKTSTSNIIKLGTRQEIYDTVVGHLRKQGRPAMVGGSDNVCAYRGADGTSCAVGCLIPDEYYDDKYEGHNVGQLVKRGYLEFTSDTVSSESLLLLLRKLQGAHDGNPRYWEFYLQGVAKHLKLTYTPATDPSMGATKR